MLLRYRGQIVGILAAVSVAAAQVSRGSTSESKTFTTQGTQTDEVSVEPFTWQNPGGMWTPELVGKHEALLKRLGLEIPASNLSDPSSSTLQAIVSLGYCSGSFISPDGLIITNHHCAQGMLSYLSNFDSKKVDGPARDFVKEGFYASRRAFERNGGPTERIFVTQALRDVTQEVTEGLDKIDDWAKRGQLIEDRIKALIAAEEASGANIRAEVKSFFADETFTLIRKLELKDVRLVFAPPASVGYYGGDSDNWVWPRHCGDFAILRAYVAPDGSSREFHQDNIPYKPQNYLTTAVSKDSWLKKDDLVLVAGYPGHTNRLDTASEVKDDILVETPYMLEKYRKLRHLLQTLANSDESLRIKLESRLFSMDNFLKKNTEGLEAAHQINYLQEKLDEEAKFTAWILSNEERKEKWASVFDMLEGLRQHFHKNFEGRDIESDLIHHDLLVAALSIIRMAEERPKPDAERHPAYQERNWKQWHQTQISASTKYDRRISSAVLRWKLANAASLAKEAWTPTMEAFLDREALAAEKGGQSTPYADQFVETFYRGSKMEDLSYREHLFDSATLDELKASDDTIIQLAFVVLDRYKELEQRAKEMRGAYLPHSTKYIKALRAYHLAHGRLLAPDANSTLRITFGHVKGYRRPKDGSWQAPFTNVMDFHTKHKWGDKEYEAPAGVLRALHQRSFAPYTEESFGNVPVNFLASVDTTGGNSGSAALNRKGELVGLLFDGNQDSLFSDWVFKEDKVRSILVDIRYVLWYLEKVAGAEAILKEMGAK